MQMFIAMLCMALTLIIYCQVIGFWLLGLVINSRLDRSKMTASLVSFLMASILVIGIPLGAIKSIYPKTNVPTSVILEEVRGWMR